MDIHELNAQVMHFRAKVAANTATQEDMKRFLTLLRESRGKVPLATGGSKTRASAAAKKAAVNSDDLLNELDGL